MLIVGAGLSGLIAATVFSKASIAEISPEPKEQHHALLRFRSDIVSRLTNIPFRKVNVRKGIWSFGEFREPTIQLANWYSNKVVHRIIDRSIWDLAPVARYIAPPDFYWQLVSRHQDRIEWGCEWEPGIFPDSIEHIAISTIPMPVALDSCGIKPSEIFARLPINVRRFKVDRADVHQTIYFPDDDTFVYRASMTGDMLIVESINPPSDEMIGEVAEAFGIEFLSVADELSQHSQKYGKIAPIDEAARRHYIRQLTQEHKVYSLGRFAVWRNILLDDLVNDIDIIAKLIEADGYSSALIASKGK